MSLFNSGPTGVFLGPVRSKTSSVSETVAPPSSLRANVPTAQVGMPVPYVIGRRRVSRPNVIGYGNLQALYKTETKTETKTYRRPGYYDGVWFVPPEDVTETIITETTIPIGFTTDILVGVCLGPGVVLRGIFCDNVPIWLGTAGPARTLGTTTANDTAFSECEFAFNGGAYDQALDPWITDADSPAYVGISYIILRGMRADIPLGSLSFEVERFPNPLGLTSGQNRLDDDINCATAMYDVITNGWGGAGVPASDVDAVGTFRSAALTYAAEANYCSVLVENETRATAVLDTLQTQTYSIVYQNPSTGKIEVKPVRQVGMGAPSKGFGRNNTIELRSFDKTSWASTLEVLRGIYVERADDYEPTPVMVQNIASISATGRAKRSGETSYPYCTKSDLTLFLTSRDLAIQSVPRFGATVLVNRDGATCLPGDIISLSDNEFGMWGVPAVVTKVRKSPIKENHVLLTVVQYLLPATDPIFDTPDQPYDPGIDYSPISPLGALILTAPYWLVARAGLTNYDTVSSVVYPVILPVPANDIQISYDTHINNVPGIGQALAKESSTYTTYGQLSADISRWDGINTGTLSSIVIDSVINPVNLKSYTVSDQRSGRPLVFIGNEIFTFTASNQIAPGQWELTGVNRAMIDTVPQNHAQGAAVFIVDGAERNVIPVAFDYPLTYTPQWRLVSSTTNERGRYADAFASNSWNSANMPRTLRPIRPHDTRIDGVRSQSVINLYVGTSFNVTWRTRSRGLATLAFQTDAAQPAESTVGSDVIYHRVYLRDSGNTLHLLGSTTSDGNYNALAVSVPPEVAAGAGTLFVRSVNQHGESLFDDTLPVNVWPGSQTIIRYAIEA